MVPGPPWTICTGTGGAAVSGAEEMCGRGTWCRAGLGRSLMVAPDGLKSFFQPK